MVRGTRPIVADPNPHVDVEAVFLGVTDGPDRNRESGRVLPSGTLSDVLKDELQDITSRRAGLGKGAHPVERLARVAAPTIEALRQVRNTSDRKRQAELTQDAHHALLSALGYAWKRETALTALNGNPVIPLVGRVADASGRDALWILEAPIVDVDDEAADPLGAMFIKEQFRTKSARQRSLRTIDATLAAGDLRAAGRAAPHPGPWSVTDRSGRQTKMAGPIRAPVRPAGDLHQGGPGYSYIMACLISREARVPEQGAPIFGPA